MDAVQNHATSDFRTILLNEFEKRQRARMNYSVRAFARDIGLTPSTLSDLLNKKHGLSLKRANDVARRLKFSDHLRAYFLDLVESQCARTEAKRKHARERLKHHAKPIEYKQLTGDALEVFGHWSYVAILAMIDNHNGAITPAQMANSLNLKLEAVSAALDRLTRLQVIHKSDGRFMRLSENFFVNSTVPSQAIRRFHKEVMDVAKRAIEEQEISRRKFLTSVLSFDACRVDEARLHIENVHAEFIQKFGTDDHVNSVYAFAIQFFQMDAHAKGLPS